MTSGRKRKERRRARAAEKATSLVETDSRAAMNPETHDKDGSGKSIALLQLPGPSVPIIAEPGSHRITKDLLLAEMAIKKQFPIDSDTRAEVVTAARKHVGSTDAKTSIAAQRVLIAADSVNQRREAIAARLIDDGNSPNGNNPQNQQNQINPPSQVNLNVGVINLPANERRTCIASIVEKIRTEGRSGDAAERGDGSDCSSPVELLGAE